MPAPHQSTPGASSDQPVDVRSSIFQTLIGKGLTPNQALGVLYSMGGEGGVEFNPKSIGDNGNSVGWGQWNGPRRAALESAAKELGTTWDNPSAQLKHFQNEINGPYASAIDAVKKGNDSVADATRIWTGEYERPAVNNWQQRLGSGSKAFSLDANNSLVFKPGTAPSLATAPSAAPATSGAQDFAEAAKRGDVGGALAALNKGDDKGGKGALGNLGDQLTRATPAPQPAQMLPTPQDNQGGQAQAGQALLGQVLQQGAQPLTWSTRPYGFNAGPQAPGTTLNSLGY